MQRLSGVIPMDLPLGMRLELARRHAGLTQTELANMLDTTQLSITRYERGKRVPKSAILMAWSAVTGVDYHWLETGEAPSPDGDGASAVVVRHQGLEPRTRWFGVGISVADVMAA